MNLIDCAVTKILSKPYRQFGNWRVDVEYDAWGSTGRSNLMFRTEEGARAVTVGHVFQS
jgi:hypothetical protein